jgi:hypothetical protein
VPASNQALVAAVVTNPENEVVVRRIVARARIEGKGEEEQIELALDLFVGLPPCSAVTSSLSPQNCELSGLARGR